MLIEKQELPEVAMEFMNDVHDEDVTIMNEIYDLLEQYEENPTQQMQQSIDKKYQEWFEHTIAHFKGEEDMMIQTKFPPYPIHKGEHDNALRQMDAVFRVWQEHREARILKEYLEQTKEWLLQHIQTLDTVTAMFFKTGMSPCSL